MSVPNGVSVMAGLLQIVKTEYQASGQLSPGVLHSLHTIHGQSLVNALDLIDSKKIKKVTSSCGRWLYQVTGSSGTPYVCLPNSAFCQCPAFKFNVVKRRDNIVCKHVLAARLSTAMGVAEEKSVSDEYIADVLAQMG
ncbi:Zinc finger SWIM domain-containing protein 7-like [Homarus americanus]|uniref:Zinc finger SWIM domain-containing protein 7-like n=1 Tax=Homarus americanus TaxID=6706 RepID=A0A8J5JDV3_HOMAM|nr:Zinc finger SWIM domain-containing protein 7-like [Homarus americanus]